MRFLAIFFLLNACLAQAQMRERFLQFFEDPFRSSTSVEYSFMAQPINTLFNNSLGLNQVVFRDETNVWRASGRFGNFNSSGTNYPSSLWNLEAGASYSHKVDPKRDWGVRTSVGSASDIPFNSLHETVFRVSAYAKLPSGERNSWLLSINYANDRVYASGIPVPGVAYLFRSEDEKLVALLGLPFAALIYNPTPDMGARLSYVFPYTLSARVFHTIVRPVAAFLNFDWSQEVWLLANRPDTAQRLFYSNKLAGGGLRMPLAKGLLFELGGGYSFGRRIFEASSILRGSTSDEDLSPSPYAVANLALRL